MFPLRAGGRMPRVKWGTQATTDPAIIRCWWRRWPASNIGIATGTASVDIIDIDCKDGKPGLESLERLRAAGLLDGAIGEARTPSGGQHVYFAGSGQRNATLPDQGVDFRSAGGMVLAPPSIIDGRTYEWVERWPWTGATVDWSAIRRLLVGESPDRRPANADIARTTVRPFAGKGGPWSGQPRFDKLIAYVARQEPGNRNAALHWAGCRAVEQDASETVLAELVDAAVAAGLSRTDAEATVRSARTTVEGSR